jgi:hypothetical protein
MRPVRKGEPPPDGANTGSLLNVLGAYCSTCEIPLPAMLFLWHPAAGVLPTEHMPENSWPEVLVICRNCADAAALAPPPGADELRPDRDLTFKLGDDSAFLYSLSQASGHRLLDADGQSLGAQTAVDAAIVRASTPGAQATLDRFALNTPYYDPAADLIAVPIRDHERMLDRRLELRTEAWHKATEIAGFLRIAQDDTERRAITTMLRMIVASMGFWSTWATVLWNELGDRALLQDVLLPQRPAAPSLSTQALWDVGTQFAGTRSDALQ